MKWWIAGLIALMGFDLTAAARGKRPEAKLERQKARIEALLDEAQTLLTGGDYAAAAQRFETVLEIDPGDRRARLGRRDAHYLSSFRQAEIDFTTGRLSTARKGAEKALEWKPGDSAALSLLARVTLAQNKLNGFLRTTSEIEASLKAERWDQADAALRSLPAFPDGSPESLAATAALSPDKFRAYSNYSSPDANQGLAAQPATPVLASLGRMRQSQARRRAISAWSPWLAAAYLPLLMGSLFLGLRRAYTLDSDFGR